MRVLLGECGESRSPASASRRVDGDAYVATPSRPKDINADAVVMKVRGDCTRYGKSNLLFNLREKCRCVFRTPRCINQKQLITITDNETIGRVDRAIKRLRCDMRPNTIGNLVKSDLSDRNFVDCRILTTRLPEWANGLATAMTDAVM